jgi:uncharacterized protein (DUF433 family)
MEATASTQRTLLGRGIYDSVEIARLIHRHPETVARWCSGRNRSDQIVRPHKGVFTFLDLISLYVVSELVARNVKRIDIIRGRDFISSRLDTQYPFAHQRLATVGSSFFAHLDEFDLDTPPKGEHKSWVDAGLHGQMAFEDVIQPLIRPIEYGTDELAAIWRPYRHVWINPEVQAGAPCIDGTRVPTRMIWDLVRAGQPQSELTEDYLVSRSSIKDAVAYEVSLGEVD